MLAAVRIFSWGDIYILIGGLNMEKFQPKAEKPHQGRERKFWMGVRMCEVGDIIKSY